VRGSWLVLIRNVPINFGVIWRFVLSFFLSIRLSEMLNLIPKLTPIMSSVHVDD